MKVHLSKHVLGTMYQLQKLIGLLLSAVLIDFIATVSLHRTHYTQSFNSIKLNNTKAIMRPTPIVQLLAHF